MKSLAWFPFTSQNSLQPSLTHCLRSFYTFYDPFQTVSDRHFLHPSLRTSTALQFIYERLHSGLKALIAASRSWTKTGSKQVLFFRSWTIKTFFRPLYCGWLRVLTDEWASGVLIGPRISASLLIGWLSRPLQSARMDKLLRKVIWWVFLLIEDVGHIYTSLVQPG